MRRLLAPLLLCLIAPGCAQSGSKVRHDLEPTKGRVRFAKSQKGFYDRQWRDMYPKNQHRICAGFVHSKRFGHYLRYGSFRLERILEVYLGGTGVRQGGRITAWQGGKLIRTLKKTLRVRERQSAYLWCMRIQKGGSWKVGAMKLRFVLRGSTRAEDEHIAQGFVQIVP